MFNSNLLGLAFSH